MNFNLSNEHYVKWCKSMGVSPNAMQQEIWPKLFECLNKVMADSCKCSPTVILEVIDIDGMSEDELKSYIADNGGTFHHMNKRGKLIEIAKSL